MSKLEQIVEELKTLPPSSLDRAADFIHRLSAVNDEQRRTMLKRTAGSLTNEEADELERVIEEGCEHIDERDW